MVSKIIGQWEIGKYIVLELDQDLPMTKYDKYRIDGKDYSPVPVYDFPKHIAIEAHGNFKGKKVEFV